MTTAPISPPPGKTMDLETFGYLMRTQGYVVIPDAISDPALIAALRDQIDTAVDQDRAAREGEYTETRFYDIVHLLVNRGDAFVELLERSPCLELYEAMVGPTCVLHSYNAVKLMPDRGNNASVVHRDSPRYSPGYMLSVQGLLCVDDFTEENGATWLLPASHQAEGRPSDDAFDAHAVQVPAPAGSMIVFDSSVWHRSGVNRTDNPRRGITLVYTRAFMKQQIDLPRATDPDVLARISERTRRLLGFDVRVPTSLDEFFLPQDQRLYKGGQG